MEKRNENSSEKIVRIAITGPESTGKSALCVALANHYHTVGVPEYARGFITVINRPYTYKDLVVIARLQMESERRYMKIANKILFCDTELTVMKIWAEHRYNKCHNWILKKLNEIQYDHYFLCNIDLPWQPDPQREHPDLRDHFFELYKAELTARNLPFTLISGQGDNRLAMAIQTIDRLLNKTV